MVPNGEERRSGDHKRAGVDQEGWSGAAQRHHRSSSVGAAQGGQLRAGRAESVSCLQVVGGEEHRNDRKRPRDEETLTCAEDRGHRHDQPGAGRSSRSDAGRLPPFPGIGAAPFRPGAVTAEHASADQPAELLRRRPGLAVLTPGACGKGSGCGVGQASYGAPGGAPGPSQIVETIHRRPAERGIPLSSCLGSPYPG